MASEHYDSERTHLFAMANFNGSFERSNVVDVLSSVEPYLTPYNVVYRNASSMFLYGGGYGDEGGLGAFAARIDPQTLETVWFKQLVNTVANPNCNTNELSDWNYPGVVGILKDGSLYVIYGYRLAKLDPDGNVIYTNQLPTYPDFPLGDTSYNGFDALPDGTIIAKTVYRATNCPCQGFLAFTQCPGETTVPPSLLVAIDAESGSVIAQLVTQEFMVGRATSVQFQGTNYIYLAGQTNVYRYIFESGELRKDDGWKPAPYRDGESGQQTASALIVMNDWVVFTSNGGFVPQNTTGSSPWLTVFAINQADASNQFKIQPFASFPSPTNQFLSFAPSSVTVDPLRNRIFAFDSGPGKLAALDLKPDGLHTNWMVDQRTTEFMALIGPRERRVLVATDIGNQTAGKNTNDTVVWRDAETGKELARSPELPAVNTGTMIEPGYGGQMYYMVQTGAVKRLSVRPAPSKSKSK
jgi:hypothetical protein